MLLRINNCILPLLSLIKVGFVFLANWSKVKRLPFNSSSRILVHPLELIHTDIWTSPIKYVSGVKYYVIFIDDFSRYS